MILLVSKHVKIGSRIAQIIFEEINTVPIIEGKIEDSTSRGASGFGSTGTGDSVRHLVTTSWTAEAPTLPPPLSSLKTIRFLHLFSGLEHDGDLSWWFRKLGPAKGFAVLTLNVDIVQSASAQ